MLLCWCEVKKVQYLTRIDMPLVYLFKNLSAKTDKFPFCSVSVETGYMAMVM